MLEDDICRASDLGDVPFALAGYGISNQEEGCCVREAVARHRLGVIDLGGYLASLFDADNQLIA